MIWPKEKWFEPVERFRQELGTLGEGVTVGVWDDGLIRGASAAFGNRLSGKSYVDADEANFWSEHGGTHGSEIARIIAGNNDHWGIAPEAAIMVIKGAIKSKRYEFTRLVADAGTYASIDVLNMSYAIDSVSSDALAGPLIAQLKAGVDGTKVIIAGMGNLTRFAKLKQTYPSCLPNVVGVNATLGWTTKAYQSSTLSKDVDVCAPGNDLHNCYSEARLNGTSFSTAIVSGLCALVMAHRKQRGMDCSAARMHALLKSSCSATEPVDLFGNGVLDLSKLAAQAKTLP